MKCIQIGDSDVIPSVEQAFSDSCENLNTGSLIPLQNTSYITWRFNFCYSLLRIIMKNPLCRELLLSWPTGNEYVKLYSWFITNCVFNSFLSITAIIFNCVTIKAVTTTSSLPKTLRTLLLSLAVSDLAVGLLAQPLTNGPTCPTYTTFIFIGILFSAASFFGVMALSVDRFLAIHFHLRYEELVTHKRVVSTVISLWVFSAILSSFTVSFSWNTTSAIFAPIGVSCLVISAVLYCKICFVVRRHKSQIHVVQIQQVEQDTEAVANLAVSRKSAAGAFYVYVVFLICYCHNFVVLLQLPQAQDQIPQLRFLLCLHGQLSS